MRERLFTSHHHKNRTLTTRSATGEVLRVGEKNVEFVQSMLLGGDGVRTSWSVRSKTSCYKKREGEMNKKRWFAGVPRTAAVKTWERGRRDDGETLTVSAGCFLWCCFYSFADVKIAFICRSIVVSMHGLTPATRRKGAKHKRFVHLEGKIGRDQLS